MPAKNLRRTSEEGVYSHIYNKGVEGRIIFNAPEDYQVFLGFLRDYLTDPKGPESTKQDFTIRGRKFRGTPHQPKNYAQSVELIAYSLMPDHFDLLLHQKAQGSIEKFLRSLSTRYSIYFNKKYKRTGTLFEGPYKSIYIKDDFSLIQLTRFFHRISSHSSYPEYLGTRVTPWVKPEIVLSSLGNQFRDGVTVSSTYRNFVEKDEPLQIEKERLSGLVFDAQLPHLVRSVPQELGINLRSMQRLYPTPKPNMSIPAPPPLPIPIISEEKAKSSSSRENIGIADIDKRVFLKLIGGVGLSLFLFSLFNKKAESLFFKSIPPSSRVSLEDIAGNKIDPAQNQPTDGYRISEIDDNEVAFYGFINKDGAWFVMKEDTDNGSYRYARGDSNFSSNWSNREQLKYDYFNNVF